MIKVFQLALDMEYQELNHLPEEPAAAAIFTDVVVHGIKHSNWEAPDFYIYNPLYLSGSFLRIGNRIVTKPELKNSPIHALMEKFGWLAPVEVDGISGYDMWVPGTEIDVFDFENGAKPGPMSYNGVEIKSELLTRPQVFRIPQLQTIQFLCTGFDDTNDDFYHLYHELGLTGLEFELVWEGG